MSNTNKEISTGIGMGAGYAAMNCVLGLIQTTTIWMIQNPEMREDIKEKYYEIITPPEGVDSRVWK